MRSLFASSLEKADTYSRGNSKKTDRTLLSELLVLIGHYVLGDEKAQESLNWGLAPTPLQSLCSVPFSYFSTAEGKRILLPTMASVCYGNPRNTGVVAKEFSMSLISEYIAAALADDEGGSGDAGARPTVDLALRYPREYWSGAVEYFTN